MNCIEVVCLYLKQYIYNEQFEKILYENVEKFETIFDKDIVLDMLCTDFHNKNDIITLKTKLKEYIYNQYKDEYNQINDAYIESKIKSEDNIVSYLLKINLKPKDKIIIDCYNIKNDVQLLNLLKNKLEISINFGLNWDAMKDIIYAFLPNNLIFLNWSYMEKIIPKESKLLKEILNLADKNKCIVYYY